MKVNKIIITCAVLFLFTAPAFASEMTVEEAIRLADRIILLSSRPGRIQKEFFIEIPRPREAFGKEIIEIHKEILCNFMLCCPECFG